MITSHSDCLHGLDEKMIKLFQRNESSSSRKVMSLDPSASKTESNARPLASRLGPGEKTFRLACIFILKKLTI